MHMVLRVDVITGAQKDAEDSKGTKVLMSMDYSAYTCFQDRNIEVDEQAKLVARSSQIG